MATLDVTGMAYVGFPTQTTVTAPDGNTYEALVGDWYGIPFNSTSMTVTPAGDAMCMSHVEVCQQAASVPTGATCRMNTSFAMTITHVKTSA